LIDPETPNPWNYTNESLFNMYRGGTEGGECPIVVDKDSPSCGDSRFGCYVCTMVSEDKSMTAMIKNDDEKKWMQPLLDLRNEIDINDPVHKNKLKKLLRDKKNRDFRRMNGHITVHISKHGADIVPGPYIQQFREHLLKKLLEAQVNIQTNGPKDVKNLELLTLEDLEAIRQTWLEEKHEIEDNLPVIYESVMKTPYPGKKQVHHPIINHNVLEQLKLHCFEHDDSDGLVYQQARAILAIVNKHNNQLRRANLSTELGTSLNKSAFSNLNEAKQFALEKKRHELQIQINNSPNLTTKEISELNERIAIITRSLKQEGYSSLHEIEIEETSYDL